MCKALWPLYPSKSPMQCFERRTIDIAQGSKLHVLHAEYLLWALLFIWHSITEVSSAALEVSKSPQKIFDIGYWYILPSHSILSYFYSCSILSLLIVAHFMRNYKLSINYKLYLYFKILYVRIYANQNISIYSCSWIRSRLYKYASFYSILFKIYFGKTEL